MVKFLSSKIFVLLVFNLLLLCNLFAQKNTKSYVKEFSFGAGVGLATGLSGQYVLDFDSRFSQHFGVGIARVHSFYRAKNYVTSRSSFVPRLVPDFDYSNVYLINCIYWISNKSPYAIKLKFGPSLNTNYISNYSTVLNVERVMDKKKTFGLNFSTEVVLALSKRIGISVDLNANVSSYNSYVGIKLYGMRIGKIQKFK